MNKETIILSQDLTLMPEYYERYNKKTLEAISKASYLQNYILPERNNLDIEKGQNNSLKYVKGEKNTNYYWIQSQNI